MAGDGFFSPRMPRGRSSRMTASTTPMATIWSAAARACCAGGKTTLMAKPVRLHRPQTTTAPRMAPRLLPAPPTMSIAHTWKVRAGT